MTQLLMPDGVQQVGHSLTNGAIMLQIMIESTGNVIGFQANQCEVKNVFEHTARINTYGTL